MNEMSSEGVEVRTGGARSQDEMTMELIIALTVTVIVTY